MRRELRDRRQHQFAPASAPTGQLHVYTDGSAKVKRGVWKAGCGVWFGEKSPHNISTCPCGKQTVSRAELSAIIYAMRKALNWHEPFERLVIFSDSELCVKGINTWMKSWKLAGWSRNGKPLKNIDLWKLVDRVMGVIRNTDLDVVIKHVPAHVGIYGNEKADRLAKAAVARAHAVVARSAEEQAELDLEAMADEIVAGLLANL